MAYFKLEHNAKGELRAKVQVSCKDIHTGKNKIFSKRIYNTNNLTETKFRKFVEREAYDFEEEVLKAYKEEINFKTRILTFPELMTEWKQRIEKTASHNYYLKAETCEVKFNNFLMTIGLYYTPINEITVRQIELFFKSFFGEKELVLPFCALKKDICKRIPKEDIPKDNILIKCSQYNKKQINLTEKNARRICEQYNLKFEEYFEQCTRVIEYALATIKGYRQILRTVFNEAVRYDWITKNPVCATKITSTGNNSELREITEKEVFSIKESQEFLKSLDLLPESYIHRVIPIKIMLLTGLRNGEMHGLKWGDINFEKKTLKVLRTRQYSQKIGIYEKDPKTKKSKREIPLPDYLIKELERYKEWFRLADSDFDENMNSYYLAVNLYREPCHPSSLDDWLVRFEKRTNQKHITCHGLRHTYCSILLAKNVPILTVSRYMGHSDSTVTLKVYGHFIPDTQDMAITALNEIVE